ncbi:hypothetical protein LZ30DRAFT_113398 [Colletotrichum cereale]|nr:hypothetical protein LZ30DRAFT_113398 [Colletotrichum cereale]
MFRTEVVISLLGAAQPRNPTLMFSSFFALGGAAAKGMTYPLPSALRVPRVRVVTCSLFPFLCLRQKSSFALHSIATRGERPG